MIHLRFLRFETQIIITVPHIRITPTTIKPQQWEPSHDNGVLWATTVVYHETRR